MAKVKEKPGPQLRENTLIMAKAIPFWPEMISYAELGEITGLSVASLQVRVSTCHDRFLIFEHKGRLSRLKPDLSNL